MSKIPANSSPNGDKDTSLRGRLKEIFKNAAFGSVSNIINLGSGLLLTLMIANYLGASKLGLYAMVISLASIVFVVTNMGIQTILIREVSKDRSMISKYLSNSLGIRLFVSLPAGLSFCYLFGHLFDYGNVSTSLTLIAAFYVAFSGLIIIVHGLFQAIGKFNFQLWLTLASKAVLLGIIFWQLTHGKGLETIMMTLMLIQLATCMVGLMVIAILICPVKISADWKFWKPYIRESFPLMLAGTTETINLKIDTILMGSMRNDLDTGHYTAAYNFYLGIMILPYALLTSFFPTFTRTMNTSKEEGWQIFQKMFWVIGAVATLLGFIVSLISEEMIQLLYSSEGFAASVIPLKILCYGLPFVLLSRLCSYALLSLGKQTLVFYASAVGSVFNITANIILIPIYSGVGAAFTTIATEAIILIFFMRIISKLRNSAEQKTTC
jgi:O-antigen/teichoic acid export membrane protein